MTKWRKPNEAFVVEPDRCWYYVNAGSVDVVVESEDHERATCYRMKRALLAKMLGQLRPVERAKALRSDQ